MARHKMQVEKEYRTCDFCGVKFTEQEEEGCTHMSITMQSGNDIVYEWWNKGDYCVTCAEKLEKAILDAIPVPERCSSNFRDADVAIAVEKALIERVS